MGAYDTIELRPSWGGLSVLAFGILVAFVSFVALAARVVLGFHFWSVVLWIVLPAVSLFGSACGAVGLVRGGRTKHQRSPTAVAGLLLNGTVFLSCVAALVWGIQ